MKQQIPLSRFSLERYRFSRKLGLFVRKVYSVYNEGLGAAGLMGSDGGTKGPDPQTPH